MIVSRSLLLMPTGHLVLAPTAEGVALSPELAARLESAFEQGVGHGLLELGLRQVDTSLPAGLAYWRDFTARYVTTLCTSAHGISEGAVGASDVRKESPSRP